MIFDLIKRVATKPTDGVNVKYQNNTQFIKGIKMSIVLNIQQKKYLT